MACPAGAALAQADPEEDRAARARGATRIGPTGPRPRRPEMPMITTAPSRNAKIRPRRVRGAGGISTPSRIAASGGTRVARSAGGRPARTVTMIPTASETTIVRVSTTVPLSGRSAPNALNRASSAGRQGDPAEQAQHGPADPQQQTFVDDRAQDLRARAAERPQQSELAGPLGDGDREGVEDDEGADDQRDVGEDEQEGPQEAEVAFQIRGVLGRLLGTRAHGDGRRQDRRAAGRAELSALTPLAAATSISS